MPRIQTYEPQISPLGDIPSVAAPMVGSDSGLIAVGTGLEKAAQAYQQRQYEQDDATAVEAAAQLNATLAERRQQAMTDGSAAAPDWAEKEAEFARAQWDKVRNSLNTQAGQQRADLRGQLLLSQNQLPMFRTQALASAAVQKNKLQTAEDTALRTIQADPTTRGNVVNDFTTNLMGPAYAQLPQADKEAYLRLFRYKSAQQYVAGIAINSGADAALKSLDDVRDDLPAEQYAALRQHYTTQAKSEHAQNKEVQQLALFRQISGMIDQGGDPTPIITQSVKDNTISAEQGFAFDKQYQAAVETRKQIAEASAAWRAGDRLTFSAVDKSFASAAANAWLAEKNQDLMSDDPNVRAQTSNEIVKKGVEMNYVFPGLKAVLAAPPEGPGFAQAAQQYASLRAADPYYAKRYVSPDQSARFDVFLSAKDSGVNDETALNMAKNITPENIAKMKHAVNGTEGAPIRSAVSSVLADKPGLFSWLPFTGDMVNGKQATQEVLDGVAVRLAGNPAADINAVTEAAMKAYTDSHVRAGNVWVPRSTLGSVPSDEMENTVSRMLIALPGQLKKAQWPVYDGTYSIAPDALTQRDSRLQVFDPHGMPIPGLRLGADDFEKEYEAHQKYLYKKRISTPSATENDFTGLTTGGMP